MSSPTLTSRGWRGLDGSRRGLSAAAPLAGALVLGAVVTGCTSPAEPSDPVVAATGAAVEAVDEVAVAQREADEQLAEVVTRLRAGDETVRRLRAAATFDSAAADLDEVRDQVSAVDTAGADEALTTLAAAADRATQAVTEATNEAQEASDAWLAEYLAAELRVLEAVRAHAATGEALLSACGPHRDALLAAMEGIATAIDGGGQPDAQEAVAEIEIAVLPLLEDLVEAQARTSEATEDRAASAEALNQASADAAAVAERRPGG